MDMQDTIHPSASNSKKSLGKQVVLEVQSNHSAETSVGDEIILKTLIGTLPQYDGWTDIQKLFEFIQKHDELFELVELNPSIELTAAISKLTGSAYLWWWDHTKRHPKDSPSRIKTWK